MEALFKDQSDYFKDSFANVPGHLFLSTTFSFYRPFQKM